ncbi:MAG: DUF1007 family protein [Rhodobacteraceae bacterium]|nr:DUF1007 family protein [Paracoccaceae bacterium]
MRRLLGVTAGLALAAGTAAEAHPHVFIDTGLELVFDASGMLSGVRVTWSYDEFTSLLVLEDRGLDPDHDGVLTPEELAKLDGFDMNWDEGWPGDLYLRAGGEEIGLSRPVEHDARLENGRIVTTHLRALDRPVPVEGPGVVLAAYDPTYYVAYALSLPIGFTGRDDCAAEITPPDLTAANQKLLAAMAELSADETLEDYDLPPVGEDFADRLTVTCGAPSRS